ncbi:hypothetical protein, partial [Microcystis sp. M42BS1]|uniref:hypothetical protein n=1 Tax=Microcystis sp. M42BS1 TaxID=2771192 RepID=UPI002584FFD7
MYGPYQAIIDSDAANLREQQALMQMLQQQAGIENTRAEMQRAQEMFPFLKEAQDLQNQGQRTVNAQRTFNLDMDTQFAPTRRSLDNATLQGNLDSRLPEHIRILSAIAPQIPSPARVAWIQDYIQKNGLSGVINLAETDPEAIPTKLSAINDELMGTNLKAYIEELKQKGATERTNMTVQGRLAAKLAGGSKSDKGKGPFIPDDKKLAGAIA